MIQTLKNNDIIFLMHLKHVFNLPDDIVQETEAVMNYGFIGNNQNEFKKIPIEVITFGCLLYVCDRNNYSNLDQETLLHIMEFLFNGKIEFYVKRINKVKKMAENRFKGQEIKLIKNRFS